MFTSSEFQKETKSIVQKKTFEEIMAENSPNVAKDINLQFKKLSDSQTR